MTTRLLIARASRVSVTLYRALPWGYRVAQVFLVFAADLADTIGRTTYALFLNSGVVMDPPPNVTFGTKVDPTRLPSGYGRSFGQRVYKMLLMKAKDPELVQEILSQLLLRISDGRVQPRAGVELREAESFIFKITHNLLVDAIRSGRSRREESMDAVHGRRRWKDPDVDVAIDIDINDTTDAFQALDNLLPRHVVKGILDDLSKINKRAPEWFLAKLDGLTDQELAEVWGMDRSYPHQWLKKHQPRIEKVIQRHI